MKFTYNKKTLNFSKTFEEIADENDQNNGKININVEEKINNESFFQKNKKIILISLIAGIIIIVALIVILVVVLKKKKKKEEEKKIYYTNYCNENCLSCGINSNVQECLICKDGFDLYNGECIQYAFSAIYNITSSYDYVSIFHHSYSFDLKAVKIDNEIIRWPSSTHRFKDNGINKVYFYLSDYGQISLENFFKYVHALIEFSFNDKYTKNFTISTMRGMFECCSSLKSVSFNQFNSNYLDDIAYLFLDCIS